MQTRIYISFSSLFLQEQIFVSDVFPYSFPSLFPLLTVIVWVRINADALSVVNSQQLFKLLKVSSVYGEALLVYVFFNIAEMSVDVALDLAAYAQDDVELTG